MKFMNRFFQKRIYLPVLYTVTLPNMCKSMQTCKKQSWNGLVVRLSSNAPQKLKTAVHIESKFHIWKNHSVTFIKLFTK